MKNDPIVWKSSCVAMLNEGQVSDPFNLCPKQGKFQDKGHGDSYGHRVHSGNLNINNQNKNKTNSITPIQVLPKVEKFSVKSIGDPELLDYVARVKINKKQAPLGSYMRDISHSTVLSNNPARIKDETGSRSSSGSIRSNNSRSSNELLKTRKKKRTRNTSNNKSRNRIKVS